MGLSCLRLAAAFLVAATPATLATTGTATVTEQAAAAADTCIGSSDLYNVGTGRYITVDRNGTLHADAPTISAATELEICDFNGNWSIFGEASSGWWQTAGWANNIVLAHTPQLNQADPTLDYLLPTVGGHILLRSRGNTLYLEPTTPGDVVYAQGRSVDQWTEWGTSDPRLTRLLCPGCVYAAPAGGAWN